MDIIKHFLHRHPLSFIEKGNEDLVCSRCLKHLSSSTYGCSKCKFFIHDHCAELPPKIENFLPPCPLVLKGALQPTMKSEGEELIQHFTHWHPLTLLVHLKNMELEEDQINHFFHPCPLILLTSPFSYTCGGCDERGSALTFSCGRCHFQLDIKCALLPTVKSEGSKLIQHFSHQHPLALREDMDGSNEVRCKACGEICSGPSFDVRSLLAYRCSKCEFTLHKDCAKRTPSFKYGSHPHLLTLFYKTDGIYCDICYKKANNFCLRCVVCRFSIHLYCHPSIPKTINYKRHIHPLTLTNSPFDYELNSPEDAHNLDDEFYCDICEEKRDKENQVYYCETCKLIAETGCVISVLLPFLTISEDQSTTSSRIISTDEESSATDPMLAKLDEEIAKHSEKATPLKVEIKSLKVLIQKLQARLQELEAKLEPIAWALDKLEVDRLLYIYELKHQMKENQYSVEASPSKGLSANQS
ncbi:hypothetical protein CRYUN_Cryun12cG0025200 [Craigia yunnanensis]